MQKLQTRYPGTQSFSIGERNIFFGRDTDIELLAQMIDLERIVLVYAKSGIGKTSLINAGVIPTLSAKGNYSFHNIRFGAHKQGSVSPSKASAAALSKLYQPQSYLDKIIHKDDSLWYFAKMWQLKQQSLQNTENQTLLLILDQFEELFTFPENEVTQFKQELAELLFTNVPQRFINQLELLHDLKPGFVSETEEKLLFNPPKVKILFAIRNDRMSQLNKMSDYIPRILLKHYELLPLSEKQALDAICKPAQLDGNFLSPKFTYHEQALAEIMNFLTKDHTQKDNIESFQLQILCKVVEDKVLNKNIKQILAEHIVPVRDIYQNYYDNLIEALPLKEEKKMLARVMIEDGLIEEATKRRLQMSRQQIDLKFNIDSEILDNLVNQRLLRTEELDNFSVYELSHDTLVEPILEIRKRRKEKEALILLENERKLQLARELEEREKIESIEERKTQRKIIALVSSVAVLAVIAFIFAFFLYKEASKQTKLAVKQTNFAKEQEELAQKSKEMALKERLLAQKNEKLANEARQNADYQTKQAQKKSMELANQQRLLMIALKEAQISKNIADEQRIKSEMARVYAEQEKAKAEQLTLALMPSEALSDPFGYFWKYGKQSLANYNYQQACKELLMAKNSKNIPANKIDSVNMLYTEADWYFQQYNLAKWHFYKDEFDEAKKFFLLICNKNPGDKLSLFYAKACGNFQSQDMVLVEDPDGANNFYISKYEITNAQYARFLNEYAQKYNSKTQYTDSIQNYFIDLNVSSSAEMISGIEFKDGIYYAVYTYEDKPVVWVSWFGANAFCRFYNLTLPTQKQWEYAASGGKKSKGYKYAGSNSVDLVAEYYNNNAERTMDVGKRQQNELGLYDMSGNVSEWCLDSAPNLNGADRSFYSVIKNKIRCGGGWKSKAEFCLTANAQGRGPDGRDNDLGFRVVYVNK